MITVMIVTSLITTARWSSPSYNPYRWDRYKTTQQKEDTKKEEKEYLLII
jgi:hypothetical protein